MLIKNRYDILSRKRRISIYRSFEFLKNNKITNIVIVIIMIIVIIFILYVYTC